MSEKRYKLVCVAELPGHWGGAYDDPDEAIVACDAFHDVYDRETGKYLTPSCCAVERRELYGDGVGRVRQGNHGG
jgi:hypothetical protein